MRSHPRILEAALAVALFLSPATAVVGADGTTAETSARAEAGNRPAAELALEELRGRAVSAEELLRADVYNVDHPLGNVRDLVLNEDGTAVQYVLYEIPYPYAYTGAESGFVAFENVSVEPVGTGFGSSVRFEDQASALAPEQLSLTRAEVDHRLISNILDDTLAFPGGTARQVEDVLIDRQSGRIEGYVVDRNPDAWFNDEPLLVPADEVRISAEGHVTTEAEFAALEAFQ